MEQVRINKYLSAVGYCSRREADRLIAAGEVEVNGVPASVGDSVTEGDEIVISGKPLQSKKSQVKPVLLMFYKPRGIVCTTSQKEKDNVIDYIKYPQRIYPVGRLDKTSEGLLLLTNQGELANDIMKARNYHEKEYVVTVDRPVTPELLKKLSGGLDLGDVITRPCQVRKSGHCTFHIILTQGINRQIRRMCEVCGLRVRRLKRIRIMNILLGDLKVGEYREVPEALAQELYRLIRESKSQE